MTWKSIECGAEPSYLNGWNFEDVEQCPPVFIIAYIVVRLAPVGKTQ